MTSSSPPPPPLALWYERPARELLTEGLPLGNGRLGVLVGGAPAEERLALNEATLWAGGPYDPTSPDALAALPEVRRRVFAGEYRAAARLAEEKLMGRPKWQAPYQPLGDLYLEFAGHEGVTEYRRGLDLETAVAHAGYESAGVRYWRELFVSAADDVLVLRIRADRPQALWCVLRLASEQKGLHGWQRGPERFYGPNGFGMRGRNRDAGDTEGALRFELRANVSLAGGRALPGEELLSVRAADSLVLVLAAATSYVRFDDVSGDPKALVDERLARVQGLGFEELLARHLDDHRPRFGRLHVELWGDAPHASQYERALLPTDARVALAADGADPALAALYVQYARYLLLSCSRPGGQPATLQGLWNDKVEPPWGSKYTININTEMNYWPALPAALPECTEPLFSLLEDAAITGQRTARNQYGANGWVLHHNVDLWRAAAPVDGVEWGQWPMGGAWLCLQLWEQYLFTLDRSALERAYPLLKGACEFFLDTLVEHPTTKEWVTCPSLSPENQHPFGTALCAGPTMDNAILRELFTATAEASTALGRDDAFRQRIIEVRARLPGYRIGKGGQLQEWLEDWDLEAPEPHHRHVSHLFGLHPAQQISPHDTPDLARAARRTLELRGDAATGWSLAWKINFWARLCDGTRAHELLLQLLCPERTYTNLFDAHPPFQIDGNFGGAAGILEMLVQSRPGRLHLLPALPPAWRTGTVQGIRARQGLTLDLAWQEGVLRTAKVHSSIAQDLELRIAGGAPRSCSLPADRWTALD